ncbi:MULTISPECIES: hypothetical protein [Haloferacaceae]|uniref:Halobacterial output domain-containing protein n=2 Tax=Haloferacaceae TaxID=1644056 RepID=A0ABD6DEC3_9EURY|nr:MULTISPECIES: hypothetical protein [Halorubraceae]
MSESSTTIGDFELAGVPTSVEQISESASAHVLEAFTALSSWGTAVTINEMDEPLLVGAKTDGHTESYRLYHGPSADHGLQFAGVLAHSHSYSDDIPDRVGFVPAGDGPDEPTEVAPVETLDVTDHDRTDRLDKLLPYIRTEITDSDWVNGRGDTTYPEWGQAVRRMAEFMRDDLDTELAFDRQLLRLPRVEHALGRYPIDAGGILTQFSNTIDQKSKLDHHNVSPEAFRELLFAFATHHDITGEGE